MELPEIPTPKPRRKRGRTVALAAAAAGMAAAWGRYRPALARVRGASMQPTLHDGDLVLIVRLAPRVGSIVIAAHPSRDGTELIKRATAGPGDEVTFGPAPLVLEHDEWWIEGDAEEWSTDSRRFGPVPRESIRGRCFVVRRAGGPR